MLKKRRLASRKRQRKINSEINMTPILDMTFLLLIAFIITFPALQGGINVKLPTAKGDPLPNVEPISITVSAEGRLFCGKDPVSDEELYERMVAVRQTTPDATAHIRGDEAQSYGRIMDVIKILRRANLTKFSLVTESE